MIRLIHRLFFSLALVVAWFALAGAQISVYTVQFKAAPTREEAEEEVRSLKARNVSAYIVKSVVAGKGVFYRVRAGVFSNREDAKRFGANLQQRGVVSEFIVMPYEKPSDEFASGAAPAAAPKPKAPPAAAPQPKSPPKTDQTALNSAPAESPRAAAAANRPIAETRPNPPANSPPVVDLTPREAPESANNPVNSAPAAAATSSARAIPSPANNAPPDSSVGEATASGPPAGFARFRDPKIGYSFDYPEHWTGQPLSDKEASEQRMNAGAMFSSQKDSAFLSAIWNELDKANNPANENDVIVDVILKSMSASDGISKLEETARRTENRNGLIKTYLDLKAVFQTPEQSAPLDFLGKAVIVRASRGILLVATFYAKDAAPNVASAADRIIASARPPE